MTDEEWRAYQISLYGPGSAYAEARRRLGLPPDIYMLMADPSLSSAGAELPLVMQIQRDMAAGTVPAPPPGPISAEWLTQHGYQLPQPGYAPGPQTAGPVPAPAPAPHQGAEWDTSTDSGGFPWTLAGLFYLLWRWFR